MANPMQAGLNAHLGDMARNMTADQRERFTAQVQQRIEASGMKLSPEAIDGAFSLIGMVATGRLTVPGLSYQLIHSLKSGGARKWSGKIAEAVTPEKRAERSARFGKFLQDTAGIRAAGAAKATNAINRASESVGGRSDLGDVARAHANTLARGADAMAEQAKTKATEVYENTSELRASALTTAGMAVNKASEAVSNANGASAALRKFTGGQGKPGATGGLSGLLAKATTTVGSAGSAVDLAGVVLDSLDDVIADKPRQ